MFTGYRVLTQDVTRQLLHQQTMSWWANTDCSDAWGVRIVGFYDDVTFKASRRLFVVFVLEVVIRLFPKSLQQKPQNYYQIDDTAPFQQQCDWSVASNS